MNEEKTKTVTVEATVVENTPKSLRIIDDNGKTNLVSLTQEQKAKCLEITKNLNAKDVGCVTNYGVNLTHQISQSGGGLLSTKSVGDETDAIINEIMSELNQIDLSDLNERSSVRKFLEKIPILRSFITTLEEKIQRYKTIEEKVSGISNNINAANLRAIKDNNELQELYDNLLSYVSQLDDLIIAGDYRASIEREALDQMYKDGTPQMDVMRQETFVNQLEKRIETLRSVKLLSQTQLYEILMTQQTNVSVVDNARTLQDITMGAFKNQLKVMVAQENQRKSIATMNKVKEGINKAMKASAENLRKNTEEMAKFSNQPIIEFSTIESTINNIKEAFVIGKKIENDSRQQRQERIAKYAELEQKFKEIANYAKDARQLEQDTSVSGISITE